MTASWYVESYAEDGVSAESANNYDSFEEAFDAVKAIRDLGKTARFLAPTNATGEQIDAFRSLGEVQAI